MYGLFGTVVDGKCSRQLTQPLLCHNYDDVSRWSSNAQKLADAKLSHPKHQFSALTYIGRGQDSLLVNPMKEALSLIHI